MAFFNKGSTYNVWERKGLAPNKKGMLSISENSFDKGEVLPEHDLTYLGKKEPGYEGEHCCLLSDGRKVVVHRNHFDVSTPYNKGKLATRAKSGAPAQAPVTAEKRAELLKEKIAKDMAMLAQLEAEKAGNTEAEASVPAELPESVPDGDDEAVSDEDAEIMALLQADEAAAA